jgi:hypothetical protein
VCQIVAREYLFEPDSLRVAVGETSGDCTVVGYHVFASLNDWKLQDVRIDGRIPYTWSSVVHCQGKLFAGAMAWKGVVVSSGQTELTTVTVGGARWIQLAADGERVWVGTRRDVRCMCAQTYTTLRAWKSAVQVRHMVCWHGNVVVSDGREYVVHSEHGVVLRRARLPHLSMSAWFGALVFGTEEQQLLVVDAWNDRVLQHLALDNGDARAMCADVVLETLCLVLVKKQVKKELPTVWLTALDAVKCAWPA